jgi:type IV secretory pathway TraG/TraD family ATPase VirD4
MKDQIAPAEARRILMHGDWTMPAAPRSWIPRGLVRALKTAALSWCVVVAGIAAYVASLPGNGLVDGLVSGVIFGTPIAAAVAMYIVSRGRTPKAAPKRDGTYGDARFAPLAAEYAAEDAIAACLVYRPEGVHTESGYVQPEPEDLRVARWSWDQLSRHVLVLGATGAGKTSTVFSHLMLSARVPWVYQDQKAELPLREDFPQRPVWGLDTRGHVSRSGVWNPLDEVKGPEDVEVMSALLFPDRGDMNDWVIRGARLVFEGLLKHHRFPSLQAVAWMLETKSMDELIAQLPSGYASSLQDARTRSYFHSTMLEVLKPWNTARIAAVTMGASTVTLDDFAARGGYVLANEDKHLRQPVTLFWGMLLYRLRQRGANASPLMLLMDEFGDAGRIPNMAQALALYRSKGVAIVAGVQSLGLMRAVYGEDDWQAVRDGFGTLVVLAANMPGELRQEITAQLGKWTRLHEHASSSWSSPSMSLGGAGTSIGLGSIGTGKSTATRHPVDLVPIDQWAVWGQARAAIVRGLAPTWWVPVPVPIEPAPLGALAAEPAGDWRELERERVAGLGDSLGEQLAGTSAERKTFLVS